MTVTDPPPPPFDDTSVSNPLDCPPLRWGILGCGRVSHDFCLALQHVPTATVVACAARDSVRAQEFADKHGIRRAYGGAAGYDEMLLSNRNSSSNDIDFIDIVYVGNVHAFRRTDVARCIQAKKHVLVEKPFACTADDAKYLMDLAREYNVFIMEGMWTRFFPAVEHARRIVFGNSEDKDNGGKKGLIGEVVSVLSDFCFNASDTDPYPESFFYNRKLGGGASLLAGPYPMAAASLFFPHHKPDCIKVIGQVDAGTGVDLQATVALSFPAIPGTVAPALDASNADENTPKLPGAGMASLTYGFLGENAEATTVVGTKGRLTIMPPAHCPTKLVVTLKGQGRGQAAGVFEYEYPLPVDSSESIAKTGGYFYPNSAGFCYEAAAVARCIAKGLKEAPQYTLAETMIAMEILDQVRSQLGTKSVHED